MFSLHILFSIIASAVFATEENFNSANSILRENKRLTGQTVKTVVSSSLLSCSQACLRRSWCTSTNFNFLKKSNEENCELNKHKFSPIDGPWATDYSFRALTAGPCYLLSRNLKFFMSY